MATAAGMVRPTFYYAQPLLPVIAHTFHAGSGTAGLIVTVSQLGYAAGIAFLLPLGDLVDRRRLVPTWWRRRRQHSSPRPPPPAWASSSACPPSSAPGRSSPM